MQRPGLSPKSHDLLALDTGSAHTDSLGLHPIYERLSNVKLKSRGSMKLPITTSPPIITKPSQTESEIVVGNHPGPSVVDELLPRQTSESKRNDLTGDAFETFEKMNNRHCREYDDSQRRITQKKYLASDVTRQNIKRECDELEKKLKERQYMETPLLVDPETRNRPESRHLRATESRYQAAAISNIDSELQWIETEKALLQTLEAKEKELGPNNISTIDTVKNTARVYFNQGKLVEAEDMFLRALHGYRKVSGPTQVMTDGVINNLGRVYHRKGDMSKAEEMYVQALAGFERYLGGNHPTTCNTANRLGHVYQQQGKLQEAQKLFEKSMVPAIGSFRDLVKDDVAGCDNLQLNSKPKDNLTRTRKFTRDQIRELGRVFRSNDFPQDSSAENQGDNTRWATS